mmetsp:Transcript_28605/g.21358  ORF Transcript_28605/g.21358 Transcript_28605/m.21358 type:complete len:115 (+) Transcript_28605:504-848(+)
MKHDMDNLGWHNNASVKQKSPIRDMLNSNLNLHNLSVCLEESKHGSQANYSSNIIHRDYIKNSQALFCNHNLKPGGASLSPQPQRNNFSGNENPIRCLIANDEPFQLFAMESLL